MPNRAGSSRSHLDANQRSATACVPRRATVVARRLDCAAAMNDPDLWAWLGLDAPDARELARISVRLVVAALLAGLLGFERERRGKAAGLRTHILVGVGSAVFTMAILEVGGDDQALSRVVQGIATGIGFVGAGAILKPEGGPEHQVKGLTTAAGIWLVSAVGISIGAGRFWLPVLATILALVTMSVLGRFEASLVKRPNGE